MQDENTPNEGGSADVEKPRYVAPESQAASVNQPERTEEGHPEGEPEHHESATVQANQHAPVGDAIPKKIGKESKKGNRGSKFLIGCSGGLLILFVLFIVLMVLVISRGGADSPVMRALGIDSANVKTFLLLVVNSAFGLLSLVFFVLMIVGIFRVVSAKKGDKFAKRRGIKMAFFSFIPLVFSLIIWLALFNFIANIQIVAEQVIAEVVVVSPSDLNKLEAPVEITFSSSNAVRALQLGGFKIESVDWDFDGDGEFETPASDFKMVHLYNRRGPVNVGLRVQVVGEESPRVYNKIINIKEAVFAANPSVGTAPLSVKFDAGTLVPRGTQVKSIDWDFDGDGVYELEGPDNLRPKYTFEQIGVWNVHLRVVDAQNNVENYFREIEIVPSDVPLLQAKINATPSFAGTIPFKVRFDASDSKSLKGTITKYEWDFGDGSELESGRSVTHVYNTPDTYKLLLTITDDIGKEATASRNIEVMAVSSIPVANIVTDPPANADGGLNGDLPLKISFDASGSTDEDGDIVSYTWDFDGDGITDSEGTKAVFTYENEGDFTATLTVQDSLNNESTANVLIKVSEPGVRSIISANPSEGVAPLIIEFDGSGSTAFEGNIVSYEWDFGDGSPKTITGATISHKYDRVGTYTVKMRVVTNKNESAESEMLVYVREIPLRACFTPSRSNGQAPLAVSFDSKCATGSIANYNWNFGDGNTSTSRKPSHTFENPGTYTVTLEVSDDKNNVNVYSDVIVAEGQISQ